MRLRMACAINKALVRPGSTQVAAQTDKDLLDFASAKEAMSVAIEETAVFTAVEASMSTRI